FDRGPREHNSVYAFLHQRLNRHRDCQVGLAGTGDADAEHDVVLVDRFDVTALVRGSRGDLLLAGWVDARASEVVAQGVGSIFGYLFESRFKFVVGHSPTFFKQVGKIFENLFDYLNIRFIAFDHQIAAAQRDSNPDKIFEVLYVFVVRSKKSPYPL